MQTIYQMLIVKGVFVFILGFYAACNAVDADTWLTVNPTMMNAATILSVAGMLLAFLGWLMLDHHRLHRQG